jgi:hypothetical protein
MTMNVDNRNADANRDPLTGAAGAHPVGTGLGAAMGAIGGGLAEKGVAEAIDPTRERAYWSENFSGRDYVEKGSSFDDYGPAYGFGVNARGKYPGRDFDDVESEMSRHWAASRGASSLSWERAKHAARDAWNRISPSR